MSGERQGKSGTSELVTVGNTGIFSKSMLCSGDSGAGAAGAGACARPEPDAMGRFSSSAAMLKDEEGGLNCVTALTAGAIEGTAGDATPGVKAGMGTALLATCSALRARRVSEACTICSIELALLVRRDGSVQMPALEPERSRPPPSGLWRRGAGAVGFLKTKSSLAGAALLSMALRGERTRGEYCMEARRREGGREVREERRRTYTQRKNEGQSNGCV